MAETECQIRKLRLSLETYREFLLNIYSILLWERQWHPTSLAAGCTVIFMLIWLSESNLLTVISLLGLIITIGDYTLPTLISTLYKEETWNTRKQNRFEELCTNIILYKTKFELLVSAYYRMRETNPKMYFTVTIVALSILTWIGGRVNNLFLTYLFIMIVLLLPGMIHHGFLNKLTEQLSKLFTDLVENAKAKVGQKKIQ
ncbi:ADP-ribosylation factor-like protein 6-interacting protein 1 isoform X2 [Diorhabda carinulata]|uniref:ADP-ribosylation factor-like protein 6-interacting protein 1 isoform X2 n=1 Tax=Diorhabda carinulata TaxID=1163345 RepID=UPI0025A0F5B7|nr:ADP-ribosylation factor-like protein 6-interacting protein 1 isoform X2 [Diorhabda carinulata]